MFLTFLLHGVNTKEKLTACEADIPIPLCFMLMNADHITACVQTAAVGFPTAAYLFDINVTLQLISYDLFIHFRRHI